MFRRQNHGTYKKQAIDQSERSDAPTNRTTNRETNEQAKTNTIKEITAIIKSESSETSSNIEMSNQSNSNSSDNNETNAQEWATEITSTANKPPIKAPICYSVNQIEVLQTLGNFTFAANYEADDFLQKIAALVKHPEAAKINRLPAPWREKFRSFSIDANNYLYMDERLVIPKALKTIIIRSLHYGHPGRDAMLAVVSNVWWPRLHREVIGIARACPQCQQAGKNIKPLMRQKEIGKLPRATEHNQEIAIDFAGPFQNAISARKYLLVSIDHHTGWPDAKFLRKPTTEKVIEFLKKNTSPETEYRKKSEQTRPQFSKVNDSKNFAKTVSNRQSEITVRETDRKRTKHNKTNFN